MCGEETIQTVCANLSDRREFLTTTAGIGAVLLGMREALSAEEPQPMPRRVVDLTHPLTPDFPTFKGESTFSLEPVSRFAEAGWNHQQWKVYEHTGTHLDAPIHRSEKGLTVDLLDPAEFILPLVVIDIKARAAANPLAQVTPDDVTDWERKHGPLPREACVAMNSGWADFVKTPRFRGADAAGVKRFPGFHEETAALLLERQALALGVDTLSLDIGSSTTFPTHTRWLPAGRWAVECLANLDQVPARGAQLFVGIPKVAGATGGPCRVLALV